ncbi:unnamed protein product [Bursaphelenchus xylophilus]|uniref:(pine wood nematode) hypothetical protein n=1 Tax=Bursaphelenchus xylophilus TaxID=6326 RepID=A0A1I7RTC9_BURXY|nr:unnamed protein product [Bursaphelenchus xylophilus]CAG9122499.1 unnamed protein product [Bursaphelenchus xylophilus]
MRLSGLSLLVLLDSVWSVLSLCSCSVRHIRLNAFEPQRQIFSPDYPRPYCGNIDCLWIIEAPSNTSVIRFYTRKVDLRLRRDSIRFYDSKDLEEEKFLRNFRSDNASAECHKREECEYKATGPRIGIRFVAGRGVPDNYGFQATVSLFNHELDYSTDDSIDEGLVSFWNFLVWVILVFCLVAFIFAVIYLACLKRGQEENRSPLLNKSVKEESIHLSIHSENELSEGKS